MRLRSATEYVRPLIIGALAGALAAMTIVLLNGQWAWSTFWTAAQAIATALAFLAAGWYALIARRQTKAIVAQQELAVKDYLERNKPVVYIERAEDPARGRGHAEYVAHNVGGGFAVNVYFFDLTVLAPVAVGALGAGERRTLPAGLNHKLCEAGAGLRMLVVAEAPFTRTTQWTVTLNLRTETAGDHGGQVLHRPATVSVPPPRFQNQSLQEYMRANDHEFRRQLHFLDEATM